MYMKVCVCEHVCVCMIVKAHQCICYAYEWVNVRMQVCECVPVNKYMSEGMLLSVYVCEKVSV